MGTGEREGTPWRLVATYLFHVKEMSFRAAEGFGVDLSTDLSHGGNSQPGDGAWHLQVRATMAWGLVWLMRRRVLIVLFSVFSPCMKWRGDALRPLQPLLVPADNDTCHPDGEGGRESAP